MSAGGPMIAAVGEGSSSSPSVRGIGRSGRSSQASGDRVPYEAT